MPDFKLGNTEKILQKYKLDKECACFELSERGTLSDPSSVTNLVRRYKQSGFAIAIDDFGTGIAGFQMLYYAEADFIKIDRFFIENIQNDNKKRLFCQHIINIAHTMGITVIAEGVETKEEYYICKEIGANLLQGYFVQKPTLDIANIQKNYLNIKKIYEDDSRTHTANSIDSKQITYMVPLFIEDLNFKKIFQYFKQNKELHFIPVIDKHSIVKGIICENEIRDLSYSQYGMSLVQNDDNGKKLSKYIKDKNIVRVEISWSVDKILEVYHNAKGDLQGLFVTNNGKYLGFINSNNLLSISYKRNVALATQKNPLTKLPGNDSIKKFIKESFHTDKSSFHTFVYFDFNDFKPFNDSYGFRTGDRVILLFSEILKKEFSSKSFIAHIGGDDFFVGFKNIDYPTVYRSVESIQKKFKEEVSSIYSRDDRQRGYISTQDRFGIQRNFNLLSVSAAIIEIQAQSLLENFDVIMGEIKKESKKHQTPIGCSILKE
ncbi:bifunctional diguanylate cyclase/phosphodiesterase [Sulfurimonas sp. NWX79]|uniref:GGDEF domain-containing protein n=1 Tax=Sulfurimonas sp. NWX79 TaxID=2925412 RepID=UPI003204D7AA